MPMRVDDRGTVHLLDRWDGGLSWQAHPGESFRRTSHALAVDDEVWLVDPLDAAGLDPQLADLGAVAGVTVLSEYHLRDADELARRYGVAVHLPAPLGALADRVDAPVERFEAELADTGFRTIGVGNWLWSEVALYHPDRRTLVVGDALSTTHYVDDATGLMVTPYLRPWPPRESFSGLDVDRVLVGHGESVREDAAAALDEALSVSRWEGLRTVVANLPTLLKGAYVAMR